VADEPTFVAGPPAQSAHGKYNADPNKSTVAPADQRDLSTSGICAQDRCLLDGYADLEGLPGGPRERLIRAAVRHEPAPVFSGA
jgi:hypothetical protein